MGESNYQWAVLLEKYVEKTISSEELTELHRQMDSSHLKRKQFEQVTEKDYYINRLKLLLATDDEADLKRFSEMLNKHASSNTSANNLKVTSTHQDNQRNFNNSKKNNFKAMLNGLVVNVRQRNYLKLGIIALVILLVSAPIIVKYLFSSDKESKYQPLIVDYHSTSEPEIKSYPYIRVGNLREIKYKEKSDGVLFDSMGIVITKQNDEILVDTKSSDQSNGKLEVYLVTAPAMMQKIRLPDGSLFTMNAMSSVCYSSDGTSVARSVKIHGEAYCEVKPRKRTRFTVYLNEDLEVGVMGTEFNVRSYENENPTVALKTGKIWLKRGNEEPLVMLPGQEVELTKDKKFKLVVNAKVDNDIFWINRELNIEDKNIYQVMHLIGTYYNRQVRFADSIFSGDLASGKISLEDDIDGVDSTIQDLYPVRIETPKDSLIIYKRQ